MSTERQTVTVRDLVEEAKKRVVFLIICVVGLSYLMSLTSSSVLVNLPAAALLIIILRYFSLDFDMRRRASIYKARPSSAEDASKKKPFEYPRVIADKSDWKQKVNSPVVVDALDQFSRHIVSEWLTDLWYSRITPDRQGPEELVQIINGVFGEIAFRMRDINLIDLLTRDIISVVCTQLELFRATKSKIEKQQSRFLTIEEQDNELKSYLAAENKLHPALFSPDAEHKVLQHLMNGLISLTFRPEDLQCSLFRYIVRELLACAVMRPVLNLANPRFINERIESLVINVRKPDKESKASDALSQSKSNGSSKIFTSNFSRILDPSVKGVELVQLKKDPSTIDAQKPGSDHTNGSLLSKDPLLALDARSTRSWSSLPSNVHDGEGKHLQRYRSEWGDRLDKFSQRKTEALAPENFDNMWTRGRDYRGKAGENQSAPATRQSPSVNISNSVEYSKFHSRQKKEDSETKGCLAMKPGRYEQPGVDFARRHEELKRKNDLPIALDNKEDRHNSADSDEVESGSSGYSTDGEDTNSVTGLDSPGTKVWDSKNKRNVSHIHHPLESVEGHKSRKSYKGNLRPPLHKTQSRRKRSRSSTNNGNIWQEVDRTSFSLGNGQDIRNTYMGNTKLEDSSDDSDAEILGRIASGASASSSVSLATFPERQRSAAESAKVSIIADSFLRLRCEVLGANIVKSGSKTFAVYSISVTDVDSNNWSVKRRFRHFEELHRRLKEFPEYNLHLPPKHFLSTGLDLLVIQERCKLLDQYLQKLLQLPTVSSSIEVWDFLCIDSQTYSFSNSLSIVETLPVNLDFTGKYKESQGNTWPINDLPSSKKANSNNDTEESALLSKVDRAADRRVKPKSLPLSSPRKPPKELGKVFEDSGSDLDNSERKKMLPARNVVGSVKDDTYGLHASQFTEVATDSSLPSEWVPPSLSVPILDVVDVIFQLQDGGWIRRKAFWVAKQVLQLGMGDAFDDWLIEKIQVLRRGSVVASGIRRVEQILWPDGIFITKHPKRQQPTPSANESQNSSGGQPPTPVSSPKADNAQKLEEMQRQEAERRAKFVYELMIDKAPAAIVGLVGHKEYEQSVKDLYYFIQSSVCMKQLAFDLLELLLVSAFPELDSVFRQVQDEKERFGKPKLS